MQIEFVKSSSVERGVVQCGPPLSYFKYVVAKCGDGPRVYRVVSSGQYERCYAADVEGLCDVEKIDGEPPPAEEVHLSGEAALEPGALVHIGQRIGAARVVKIVAGGREVQFGEVTARTRVVSQSPHPERWRRLYSEVVALKDLRLSEVFVVGVDACDAVNALGLKGVKCIEAAPIQRISSGLVVYVPPMSAEEGLSVLRRYLNCGDLENLAKLMVGMKASEAEAFARLLAQRKCPAVEDGLASLRKMRLARWKLGRVVTLFDIPGYSDVKREVEAVLRGGYRQVSVVGPGAEDFALALAFHSGYYATPSAAELTVRYVACLPNEPIRGEILEDETLVVYSFLHARSDAVIEVRPPGPEEVAEIAARYSVSEELLLKLADGVSYRDLINAAVALRNGTDADVVEKIVKKRRELLKAQRR